MKRFKLYNVKSFVESDAIEIKPLTFFVGRNSCGKSSLIRFPVLLAQTFKEDIITPLLLFGNMLDYGNYDDVVNKHSNESFGFSLEMGEEISRFINPDYFVYASGFFGARKELTREWKIAEEIILDVWIAKPDKKMVVEKIILQLDGKKVFEMSQREQFYDLEVGDCLHLESNAKVERVSVRSEEIHFTRFVPRFNEEDIVAEYIKTQRIPEKEKSKIQALLAEPYKFNKENEGEEIKKTSWFKLLTNLSIIDTYFIGVIRYLNGYAREVSYVGPFRENPKRTYRDSESNYDDVGVRGENAGMLLRQDAQNRRVLLQRVSEWFEESMGYTIDIKDIGSSLYSLVVKRSLGSAQGQTDNIIDVGYGISQVLPIVTELLNSSGSQREEYKGRNSGKKVFIMEQPELHLHPAAQADLAKLLVKSSNISRSRRILVETHSEHLIRKIQVLIADPQIPIDSDQVAFYYVEKDDDGNSHIRKMEINKNGQFIEPWPSGFFDKSYELASELLVANSKQRK